MCSSNNLEQPARHVPVLAECLQHDPSCRAQAGCPQQHRVPNLHGHAYKGAPVQAAPDAATAVFMHPSDTSMQPCKGGYMLDGQVQPLSRHCSSEVLTCMVMRVRGFLSRQRRIVSARAALRTSGNAMRCFSSVMACIFWMKASAEKGVWPYTIWYRMHPRLHTSDARPTCSRDGLVVREGWPVLR